MTTFKAVCKETIYAYKGKSKFIQPSFIAGKVYAFTEKNSTMQEEEIVAAINERGIESMMTVKHFEKSFHRV